MSDAVPFPDYLGALGRLSAHIDPLAATTETDAIRRAVVSLAALPTIDRASLTAWVAANPMTYPCWHSSPALARRSSKCAQT